VTGHAVCDAGVVVDMRAINAVAVDPDARTAVAFGQRGAPFNVHILSMWPDPADTEENIAWTRAFSGAMKAYAGGADLNFIGDEGEDRVRQAFGDKYPRLQALKDRYDPANLFRFNQNIKPTGG
jgi:FAD/FMN-containing dehydrogenase